MSYQLIQGDCLEVLPTLADSSIDAVVTDPPYGLSDHDSGDVAEALRCWLDGKPYTHGKGGLGGEALLTLYVCIGLAMAGGAKGDEVTQVVSFFVRGKKAIRLYVMDLYRLIVGRLGLLASHAAMLTGVFVSIARLAFLGLPVWAAPFLCNAVHVLRMLNACSVQVAAFTGAILSRANLAFASRKVVIELAAAALTNTGLRTFPGTCFGGGVLAFRRAMLAAPMLGPTSREHECLAAPLACMFCLFATRYCSAFRRAVAYPVSM